MNTEPNKIEDTLLTITYGGVFLGVLCLVPGFQIVAIPLLILGILFLLLMLTMNLLLWIQKLTFTNIFNGIKNLDKDIWQIIGIWSPIFILFMYVKVWS